MSYDRNHVVGSLFILGSFGLTGNMHFTFIHVFLGPDSMFVFITEECSTAGTYCCSFAHSPVEGHLVAPGFRLLQSCYKHLRAMRAHKFSSRLCKYSGVQLLDCMLRQWLAL